MVPEAGILIGGKRVYDMAVAERVDARGKRCPMPVLMAKRAIAECRPGDTIEILVTDPSAPKDFETFARLEGHSVSLVACFVLIFF